MDKDLTKEEVEAMTTPASDYSSKTVAKTKEAMAQEKSSTAKKHNANDIKITVGGKEIEPYISEGANLNDSLKAMRDEIKDKSESIDKLHLQNEELNEQNKKLQSILDQFSSQMDEILLDYGKYDTEDLQEGEEPDPTVLGIIRSLIAKTENNVSEDVLQQRLKSGEELQKLKDENESLKHDLEGQAALNGDLMRDLAIKTENVRKYGEEVVSHNITARKALDIINKLAEHLEV